MPERTIFAQLPFRDIHNPGIVDQKIDRAIIPIDLLRSQSDGLQRGQVKLQDNDFQLRVGISDRLC